MPARDLSGGSGARGFSAHSGPLHSTAVHLAASPDQCSTYAQPLLQGTLPRRGHQSRPHPPPTTGWSVFTSSVLVSHRSLDLSPNTPFPGLPTVLRAGTLDNFGGVFFQGSLHADTLGLDFPAPDLTSTPDSEHLTVHPFPLGRALVS